jgi:hypothetical protein
MLSRIATEVEEWLVKIEKRASGDDGIASQMIGLQNQIEDRYTAYSIRDLDKPLPATERAQLRDCLNSWVEQINTLTSNTYIFCLGLKITKRCDYNQKTFQIQRKRNNIESHSTLRTGYPN